MIYSLYLLLLIPLACIYLLCKRKQWRIQQWQKSLNLQEHAQIFQQIYQDTNGFLLSQQARQKSDALEYVYGEIEFLSFLALLSLTRPDEKTVFYDLGCGTGKAVLACAMVYPVQQSIGVELLPELYFAACKQAERLAANKKYTEQAKKIEFILGDFLEVNLNKATTIFINSTALFNPTWGKLCAHLDNLPHLTTVITTSKTLPSKTFTPVIKAQVEMSWGVVCAYIHTKKKE